MSKIIADAKKISEKIEILANKIIEDCPDVSNLVLIGIQRRGAQISQRILDFINQKNNINVPLGILDITFYRDDLSMVSEQPVVHNTDIPFSLDEKYVVLVDDVIYTGRTIRSALDALVDFGRPSVVKLFALVDRGMRELPIQPDYAGWAIPTKYDDKISVKVTELDGEDMVEIISREEEL